MQVLKVICALDMSDLDVAKGIVRRLSPHVGAFKIGHSLTLAHGLTVIEELREAGANRIFLDLKFHDIPNTVALAVREATKRGVWMLTLHTSGGPAMMTAASDEARAFGDDVAPLLMGVSVLTSLDQHNLNHDLGIARTVEDHLVSMSVLGCNCGLDGAICPAPHIRAVREAIGHEGVIVTPGIRLSAGETHDQKQVGTAEAALRDGANYLVLGRALIDSVDPEATLAQFGFQMTAR
jgi:orotidine-5'-phosphate decarboxylase